MLYIGIGNYMYRNYIGRHGIAYESKWHRNPAGRHKRLYIGGLIYVYSYVVKH